MSMSQLDDKESFIDLTPKQKAVVRAYAENPDAGHKAISERASELMEGDETVSRSYVQPILEKYPHIAERQLEKTDNQRYEGEERTEGDPFAGQLDDDKTWQTISERPYKGETDDEPDREVNQSLPIELPRQTIEQLLQGDVPEEFRRELVRRLITRAFNRTDD